MKNDKIVIDEKTQRIIQNLINTRNDIDNRIQLILQTILNINNTEGGYILSPDLKFLEKEKSNGES